MIVLLDSRRDGEPSPYELFQEIYGKGNVHPAANSSSFPTVADRPDATTVVIGDMPFGTHAGITETPTYVVLISDPKLLAMREGRGRGIVAHLKQAARNGVDNPLTRMVAGLKRGGGPCPPHALDTAKANLRTSFAAVGLAEDINRSVVMFGKKLGWRHLPLYARPATSSRVSVSMSPTDQKAVEEFCALDIELFEYAQGLFEESIANIPGFDKAVREYKGQLDDVEKILQSERDQWTRESSIIWQLSRRSKAAIAGLRRKLGLRTKLNRILHNMSQKGATAANANR